ncbi:unnamed protein product, partial [Symbiodinium sp. CCMP2592]
NLKTRMVKDKQEHPVDLPARTFQKLQKRNQKTKSRGTAAAAAAGSNTTFSLQLQE